MISPYQNNKKGHRPHISKIATALVAASVSIAGQGGAIAEGWSTDTTTNTAICPQTSNQSVVEVISDGTGGMIAVWQDYRTGSVADLYAQRFDSAGNRLWAETAVAVADNEIWNQFTPQIVPDGSGGVIISWLHADYSNGVDVYAQRLDGSGNRLWGTQGVVVCNATWGRSNHQLADTGDGGAIIVWQDQRASLDNVNIFAQKLDENGIAQWTNNGAVVCDADASQSEPKVVTDGSGGAYFTWVDQRGDDRDVYAQRLDASGVSVWTNNGIPVCQAVGSVLNPQMVSDESGGVIVAWEDSRHTLSFIYGQRLTSSGAAAWTIDGVEFTTGTSSQDTLRLISDGAGGAIATYEEYTPNYDTVMAQRLSSSGEAMWGASGVEVCSLPLQESWPNICSDGSGGAVITLVSQKAIEGSNDIFAQSIDAGGNRRWSDTGVIVTDNPNPDQLPGISSDQIGGVFIAWERSFKVGGSNSWTTNVFAQRISAEGQLGASVAAANSWELYE